MEDEHFSEGEDDATFIKVCMDSIDEMAVEEAMMEEAITASLLQEEICENGPTSNFPSSHQEMKAISFSDEADEQPHKVLSLSQVKPSTPLQEIHGNSFFAEIGESSNTKPDPDTIFCKICMEAKEPTEVFEINGCLHVFCSDCICGHITARVEENSTTVRCPESHCKGVLEFEFCCPILPPEVLDRWGSILCESLILEPMKFYCPFKDCSGLLVDERGEDAYDILESECPHCRRLFCARCKVPWHSDIDCNEFQRLNKNEREREDLMLMKLAEEKKWQRCPKCGFYVDRVDGCLFMKCRCKYCFCYHCGGKMEEPYHFCTRCRR